MLFVFKKPSTVVVIYIEFLCGQIYHFESVLTLNLLDILSRKSQDIRILLELKLFGLVSQL
tara:strand:+ start:401 stop:583 length:183 start_codon:yes stop_codon:yes gene_type:complete